jgi:hypothetical protein
VQKWIENPFSENLNPFAREQSFLLIVSTSQLTQTWFPSSRLFVDVSSFIVTTAIIIGVVFFDQTKNSAQMVLSLRLFPLSSRVTIDFRVVRVHSFHRFFHFQVSVVGDVKRVHEITDEQYQKEEHTNAFFEQPRAAAFPGRRRRQLGGIHTTTTSRSNAWKQSPSARLAQHQFFLFLGCFKSRFKFFFCEASFVSFRL